MSLFYNTFLFDGFIDGRVENIQALTSNSFKKIIIYFKRSNLSNILNYNTSITLLHCRILLHSSVEIRTFLIILYTLIRLSIFENAMSWGHVFRNTCQQLYEKTFRAKMLEYPKHCSSFFYYWPKPYTIFFKE